MCTSGVWVKAAGCCGAAWGRARCAVSLSHHCPAADVAEAFLGHR